MTNDDKDLKLKDCPFCHKHADINYNGDATCPDDDCPGHIVTLPVYLWNKRATPQQPSKPMINTPISYQQGYSDGYKEGANTAIQPSIKAEQLKTNVVMVMPQQPSEPLKELDVQEVNKVIIKKMGESNLGLADEICRTFGQPSEKKALSREDIIKISQKSRKDYEHQSKEFWNEDGEEYAVAKAIHSALPNEKKALSVDFIKEEISHGIFHCGYVALLGADKTDTDKLAQSIFNALPAQREVRYPEKMDHDHSCEFDCKGCVDSGWNQAIDEMKKLNGG